MEVLSSCTERWKIIANSDHLKQNNRTNAFDKSLTWLAQNVQWLTLVVVGVVANEYFISCKPNITRNHKVNFSQKWKILLSKEITIFKSNFVTTSRLIWPTDQSTDLIQSIWPTYQSTDLKQSIIHRTNRPINWLDTIHLDQSSDLIQSIYSFTAAALSNENNSCTLQTPVWLLAFFHTVLNACIYPNKS